MRGLILMTLCIVFIFPTSTAQLQNDRDGQWELLRGNNNTDAPTPRHENGFVQVDGRFYLIGGRGIKPLDIYDPVSDTWTQGSPPPFEMHHIHAVVYEGLIYIVAAYTGPCCNNEFGAEFIYIYDPTADAWQEGSAIPQDRQRGAAGVVLHEGLIYVLGGLNGGHGGGAESFTYVDVFDPASETWEMLPDMPRARDHFSPIVIDNKIYAIGGRDTGDVIWEDTILEIDVYDIENQTWETLTEENNIPTPRAGAAYARFGDEILVLGGEDAERAYEIVEAFNVFTNEWRTLPPMFERRHGTQAAMCNGVLYIAAGAGNRGGGPELNAYERFYLGDEAAPCLPPTSQSD